MNSSWKTNAPCPLCGKLHQSRVEELLTGKGVSKNLPSVLKKRGLRKPFLLSDINTNIAAGKEISAILRNAEFSYSEYILPSASPEPDERSVGSALMHFDPSCDCILAIGSGVIGDIAKLLAASAGKELITVATAPSMDGFASETSSMIRDGLKVSIPSRCPCVIIGDTEILKNAPVKMLRAGLGDMLAKYISICEWRIGHLITGEYYCEEIASLVRKALKKCIDNAEGLLSREDAAVEAVFEGLVLCGMAMSFAGVSRPASGVEHYISHVWEMRALEFGGKAELHGLQCAVGTLIASRLYERLPKVTPNREKALRHAEEFDSDARCETLRAFLGSGAEAMIALEKKEKKYDRKKHKERLQIILSQWDEILSIIAEEVPPVKELETLFDQTSLPKTPAEVGADPESTPMTFLCSGDIRDKYVLSRLLWDLGIEEEYSETILSDIK